MSNGFIWFDRAVEESDAEAVTDFYASVFDGPFGPDNTDGPYITWLMNEDQPWAAIVKADDGTAGRWVPYVEVEDLDDAVDKAVAAGGKVVSPRSDGPAGTAVAVADPAGAVVSLWVPYPDQQ